MMTTKSNIRKHRVLRPLILQLSPFSTPIFVTMRQEFKKNNKFKQIPKNYIFSKTRSFKDINAISFQLKALNMVTYTIIEGQ